MPAGLMHGIQAWASLYANSAVLRTGVGFAHIAGLLAGGGTAVVADRATLAAWRQNAGRRRAQPPAVRAAHRTVILGLVVVSLSGLLLLASDLDTYLHSRVFWIKMGLVALLLVNGTAFQRAGRLADAGSERAWTRLGYGAIASLMLWFAITLLGAALPNV